MKKCLTICPTRNRLDKCKEMLESFQRTSEESDIIFIIDTDDPFVYEYQKLFCDFKVPYLLLERATTTSHINTAFKKMPDYQFYHLINDDFVYRTDGWDRSFIDIIDEYGPGIAYGNDLYMRNNLPVAPMISGDIVRALGWLQMPKLTHLCGDMVWKVIGEKLNAFYYLSNVIIDHKHPFSREHNIEKDETHLYTNSKEMYNKDNNVFSKWLREDMTDDINKIRTALNV